MWMRTSRRAGSATGCRLATLEILTMLRMLPPNYELLPMQNSSHISSTGPLRTERLSWIHCKPQVMPDPLHAP